MDRVFATASWAIVVRGLLTIGFGVAVLVVPRGLHGLALLFVAYAVLNGLVLLVGGLWASESGPGWRLLVAEGLIGFLLGIFTPMWQGRSGPQLLAGIAVWGLATGLLQLAQTRRLGEARASAGLVVAGLAAIGFGGASALLMPFLGDVAAPGQPLTFVAAAYGFVAGTAFLVFGAQARAAYRGSPEEPSPDP